MKEKVPEKHEVSPILPVFEHEELPNTHSLPVPRPPTNREQLMTKHYDMMAARQRAMVGPIRSHFGISQASFNHATRSLRPAAKKKQQVKAARQAKDPRGAAEHRADD